MNKRQFGTVGEELALDYLKSRGHRILESNYRCKLGEIDIISLKNDTIHFVEVKTRAGMRFGLPRDAVTREKLRHIKNVAEVYMKYIGAFNNPNCNYEYSMDVIEVMINHIQGVI